MYTFSLSCPLPMPDDLKQRILEMLREVRSAPSGPPQVEEQNGHIVVKGTLDPLKDDFASSGFEARERDAALDLALADAD